MRINIIYQSTRDAEHQWRANNKTNLSPKSEDVIFYFVLVPCFGQIVQIS